jgi:hypothetical protein
MAMGFPSSGSRSLSKSSRRELPHSGGLLPTPAPADVMAITKSTIVARGVNVIASKRDNCDRIDPLAEFRKHERSHDEPQHRDEHCLIAMRYYPLRHRHDVTAITNSSQGNAQARLRSDARGGDGSSRQREPHT